MNGGQIFATVIFALAVVGAARLLKLALRSCKRVLRSIALTLRAIGENLASDEQDESDEKPRNRRVRAPRATMPEITDEQIAEYLARKGAKQPADTGN